MPPGTELGGDPNAPSWPFLELLTYKLSWCLQQSLWDFSGGDNLCPLRVLFVEMTRSLLESDRVNQVK